MVFSYLFKYIIQEQMKQSRGFTIIELLVSIVITSILATLLFLGVKSYIKSGQRAAEVAAGRTLMSAFHTYAADNGGNVIKALDPNPGEVIDNKGKPVMSHAARRWPWRLAPYFDYNVGVLIVNNKEAAPENDRMFSYLVTVFTTLGMNGTYIGGKGTNPRIAPKHIINILQPHKPSELIVFASAKMKGAPHPGCFDVGPNGSGTVGIVDYKYNDKAVVAYFDGHVELNTEEQLKDMRRWSNKSNF